MVQTRTANGYLRRATVRRWATMLVGSGVASLIAVACTSSSDAGDRSARSVVVLDAETGEERWHLASPGGRDRFTSVGLGSGLVVGAHGDPDRAFRMETFDAESGERRWSLTGVGLPATESTGNQLSPEVDVAASGTVVAIRVSPTEQITGLDAATGAERWRIVPPERFLGVSDTLVFTGKRGAEPRFTLNAFDRRSGAPRWSFPVTKRTLSTKFDVVTANRTTVVVASGPYDESPPEPRPTVFLVLDARTGQERTQFLSENPAVRFSDFAITDGALVYAEGPDAVARDLRTGQVRWRHHTSEPPPRPDVSGSPWMSIFVSADGETVVTSAERGFADVLDARTGAVRWTSRGDLSFRGADRSDVVVTLRGLRIASVANATGRERWQRRVERLLRAGGNGRDADARTDEEGLTTFSWYDFGVAVRDGYAVVSLRPPDN